jgi:hypothetical protein
MSDHKYPAYQPTGSETLEKLVMDPNIPKSETEGWACREIERLRARVEELERIRAVADNLFTYDSGWSHWEKKYRELRAALKEAKPCA